MICDFLWRGVIRNMFTFQFKRRVKDLLKPEYNDYYLSKWLKGMYIPLVSKTGT